MPLNCTLKNGENGKFYVIYLNKTIENYQKRKIQIDNKAT